MLKPSYYNTFSEPFQDANGKTFVLAFNSRSSSLIKLPAGLVEVLERESNVDLPEETVQLLAAKGFLVPAGDNELAKVLNENRSHINASDSLYLVLQPSAYCQLACHYCGQGHKRQSLSASTVKLLLQRVEQLLKKGRYRHLQIGWFGSEPLTAIPKIREISSGLRDLAATYGATYGAKMVTNGLLLSVQIAEELHKTCYVNSFEITLDGLADQHDARRHTKAASGTFTRIFSQIEAICKANLGVRIIIRSNVDPRNKESAENLMEMLAAKGLHEHLHFYTAPLHSWGNDALDYAAEAKVYASWEIDWLIRLQSLGFKVNLLPERLHQTCMALSPHAHLVAPDGDLYGCTEVSLVPSYEVSGRNIHAVGNVADTEMDDQNYLQRRQYLTFFDSVEERKVPCSSCKILPICGGRCPKHWEEGIVACPSIKYNLRERMLLSYLASEAG